MAKGRIGLGVFAVRSFDAGQWVGRIHGRIISDPLYGSSTCMDLGPYGVLEPSGPFRYLNHCCEPNAGFMYAGPNLELKLPQPTLWLIALQDIAAGDELTIDYAWPISTAIPCRCGTPRCRGWIVAAEQLHLLFAMQLPAAK